MTYDEVKAVKAIIRDDASNLQKYFEGLRNIRYLHLYERLYENAKKDILTWKDARESFLFNERRELFWSSRRSYSHFILLSHTVVEYLSTRLLLQYFDPTRGRAEMLSALERLSQFTRQELMHELDIISGDLNNDMSQSRGVRNGFAHEVDPHFELNYDEHPLVNLNEVKKVISRLVELLYRVPYQQIISLLDEISSDTFPDDYSTASIAELIAIYQFEIDSGPFYSQQLPRELYKRGVDPEQAPSLEEFDSIDYLDEVGSARADCNEGALVQLRASPFFPNNVCIEESILIDLQIEFSSKSMMYDMIDTIPDKFEWYCYLMVDNRVVSVYPADEDGCPSPRRRVHCPKEVGGSGGDIYNIEIDVDARGADDPDLVGTAVSNEVRSFLEY